MAANQRPSAVACSSPSGLKATSASRTEMSIMARPAACAASRATLPALSPWRTIHSRSGQRFGTLNLLGRTGRQRASQMNDPASRRASCARTRRSIAMPPAEGKNKDH
jgi:hypothetical protein